LTRHGCRACKRRPYHAPTAIHGAPSGALDKKRKVRQFCPFGKDLNCPLIGLRKRNSQHQRSLTCATP
jgi:hypothetical protein